ncbi:MAG: response regulator [Alphaproteobacteria bacterium]|nr:response regulator [Alphaproteobacteria bacterium]
MTEPGSPIEILLVEDNLGDIVLTREAFEEIRLGNALHVVEDGEEALDYLFQRGKYADAKPPDLILLDLNLPKLSGKEVLEAIKHDPRLMLIPVIVLTTSEEERDVLDVYKRNANCFITKPVDIQQFLKVIRLIESFWLHVVKLAH